MRFRAEEVDGKEKLMLDLERLGDVAKQEAIMQALDAAGDIVCGKISGIVSATAKRGHGVLASSIAYKPVKETKGAKAGSVISIGFGWKKTPIKRSSSVREFGVRGRKGKVFYVDGSGRRRKVETVADYAGILEYSEKRQLRHMEDGYDASVEDATRLMETKVQDAIDKALK